MGGARGGGYPTLGLSPSVLTLCGRSGAQVHGRKWAALEAAVPTKTATQIRNFYQNYKTKARPMLQVEDPYKKHRY